jgi:hypothetical protein
MRVLFPKIEISLGIGFWGGEMKSSILKHVKFGLPLVH